MMMRKRTLLAMLSVLLLVVCVSGLPAKAALVEDSFNRANSDTVGLMSDGVHRWHERGGDPDDVNITNNQLIVSYGAQGAAVLNNDSSAYTLADGIVTVTATRISDPNEASGITYRAASLDHAASLAGTGYHVRIYGELEAATTWPDEGQTPDIALYYGSTLLTSVDVTITPSNTPLVEVRFFGNRHIISVDGNEVIDYLETTSGRTSAGCIGLANNAGYSHAYWDNFSVSVPEPATLCLLALGGIGILIRRKRRI